MKRTFLSSTIDSACCFIYFQFYTSEQEQASPSDQQSLPDEDVIADIDAEADVDVPGIDNLCNYVSLKKYKFKCTDLNLLFT